MPTVIAQSAVAPTHNAQMMAIGNKQCRSRAERSTVSSTGLVASDIVISHSVIILPFHLGFYIGKRCLSEYWVRILMRM